MNIFLIISTTLICLSFYLVFFIGSQKVSLVKKVLFSLVSIGSIALLLVKVVDFSAIDKKETFSQEVNTELQKARAEPNSIAAWNDLGRAYILEKEYLHAYMAFTQSEQLDSFVGLESDEQKISSERMKWLTGLAEARILAQGGGVDDSANEFIQRSLLLDDQHPKALWYGGLAAAQRANYSLAQQLWEKLIQQNPPQQLKDVIQNRLDSLAKLKDSEENKQTLNPWVLSFKFTVAEKLLLTQTSKSKVFVSLRQEQGSPPIIAKSFAATEFTALTENILSLSQNDKIRGMASERSIDWDNPITLTLIWAKNGNVLDEANVRNEHAITRQNLDSVFEYTLE